MKTIKVTSKFKKDLKRYKHRKNVIDKLDRIVQILAQGELIPKEFRPHALSGNYAGYMECHVESDTLLIWWDRESESITLVRFGSHSELF